MNEELRALAEKLRELIALRELGDDDPPTDRLRALAARFPGALRELDRTPIETLTERLSVLDAGGEPMWAFAQSRHHGWLRIALRLRLEAPRTEEDARAWAERYEPRMPGDPSANELTPRVLAQLVDPPEGRLVPVALALTAEALGLSAEELSDLLRG